MRATLCSYGRPARGFTLMEVLVSIAILAMALTILIGTQSNAALTTERANQMAIASLLARGKMMDLEAELQREGFSDMRDVRSGNFRAEGFDEYRWEAEIEIVEISTEAEQALIANVIGELYGDEQSEGALVGASAVTAFLPMIIAQIPPIINEVAERTRRVSLTVTWPVGSGTQSFQVQQFVVILDAERARGNRASEPTPPTGGLGFP